MDGHEQQAPERWETLERRLVYEQPPWLRLFTEHVRLPDGREVQDYPQIETPGYAMIVPLDEQGRIGLVRSYKRGLDDMDVQPPAGMVDPDEEPLHSAKRELLEELGCQASVWQPLGSFILSGNYGAGWAHIYLATGCVQVQEPDAGDLEQQQVLWLTVEEVRTAWRSGVFRQIGASAGIGLALDRLAGQQELT
jgi:ADP-ribose pyrophosphatase